MRSLKIATIRLDKQSSLDTSPSKNKGIFGQANDVYKCEIYVTNAAVVRFLRGEDPNQFERCNLDTFHTLQLAFNIVRSFGDEVINDFDSSEVSSV